MGVDTADKPRESKRTRGLLPLAFGLLARGEPFGVLRRVAVSLGPRLRPPILAQVLFSQ